MVSVKGFERNRYFPLTGLRKELGRPRKREGRRLQIDYWSQMQYKYKYKYKYRYRLKGSNIPPWQV